MNNKKTLSWIVVLVLLTAVVVGILLNSRTGSKPATGIRVGAAIALTGYGAPFGESERNAIQILKQKFPSVDFFIEDNKSDAKEGLLAAKKLVDVHNVDVIYCDLTTVANAIVSISKEQRKVLVAAVYLADLPQRSPYAVRNLPRGIDESRLLLGYLKDSHPTATKAAAVGSNDEFGRSSLDDFKKAALETNVNIIFEDMIPDAEQQIASFAQKIAASGPEAVYAASLLPNLGLLVKELRVAGFKGEILTTDAFAYPYIQTAAGQYAKDTVYVDFPTTEAANQFASSYKQLFSHDLPPSAVLCHDGLSIIIDACNASPDSTPTQVVEQKLNGMKYSGVYGELIVTNREIIYPLVVKVAK